MVIFSMGLLAARVLGGSGFGGLYLFRGGLALVLSYSSKDSSFLAVGALGIALELF
jgi:hypothetical protein